MNILVKSAKAKLTEEEFHAVMQYGIDSDPSFPYLISVLNYAREFHPEENIRDFASDMIDEAGK